MGTIASPGEAAARTWSAPSPLPDVLGVAARLTATLAVVGAAWWLLAPGALGGSTSFLTVDGTSMLPRLTPSELVLLRGSKSYRVGDVVGYRSDMLGRVVLHRVVAIHGGRYTFKGDNNGFTDPERPSRDRLVGKLWVAVPRAGRAVDVLHLPVVVAGLTALLVLTLGLGGAPLGRATREP